MLIMDWQVPDAEGPDVVEANPPTAELACAGSVLTQRDQEQDMAYEPWSPEPMTIWSSLPSGGATGQTFGPTSPKGR